MLWFRIMVTCKMYKYATLTDFSVKHQDWKGMIKFSDVFTQWLLGSVYRFWFLRLYIIINSQSNVETSTLE